MLPQYVSKFYFVVIENSGQQLNKHHKQRGESFSMPMLAVSCKL